MSGTLYIPSLIKEIPMLKALNEHIKKRIKVFKLILGFRKSSIISLNSVSSTPISSRNNSIDYIFTDPPFGDNIMYSELNFIWEAWIKVKTNNKSEVIVNKTQNKDLPEYHFLMRKAFSEYYRVLKPDRWITVVFHNSKSTIWKIIQDSITKAGFIIAQVTVLDKKQGSFKQVTATGAVKNDLVISAYKPKQSFEDQFLWRRSH